MKTLMVLITILLVILAGIISFLAVKIVEDSLTGAAVVREYSYTKAICDKTHCQDYLIICSGENIISQTPITGAVVSHAPDWEDPRDKETINTFCKRS